MLNHLSKAEAQAVLDTQEAVVAMVPNGDQQYITKWIHGISWGKLWLQAVSSKAQILTLKLGHYICQILTDYQIACCWGILEP